MTEPSSTPPSAEPQPEASPLAEPTISELFAVDPLLLSDTAFNRIIDYFREERKNFKTEEVAKQKAPKRGEPKQPINLAELGL